MELDVLKFDIIQSITWSSFERKYCNGAVKTNPFQLVIVPSEIYHDQLEFLCKLGLRRGPQSIHYSIGPARGTLDSSCWTAITRNRNLGDFILQAQLQPLRPDFKRQQASYRMAICPLSNQYSAQVIHVQVTLKIVVTQRNK